MSTTSETPLDELDVLRKANVTLLQKSRDRKAKITEHEATIADLQSKLTTASTALYDATIAQPLRRMAETISPVPELWLTEFSKHYKVETKDGKLSMLTLDGKSVMDGESEVAFDAQALGRLLTAGSNDELASFPHIMYGSRASGGGASPAPGSQMQYLEKAQEKAVSQHRFGLR